MPFGIFRRKTANRQNENRSSGTGYTGLIMAARESYISGASGLAEVTATVQACVSLWEGAFALADVTGTEMLDRRTMALLARALALRGEAVFLVRPDKLVPCPDWDVSTRDGVPVAYRVGIAEAGGARSETALTGEILHLRIGSDPVAPWMGTAPLRRASLTAGLLHEVESALRDVYRDAPLGSLVAPLPDGSADDMATMRAAFKGRRGSTLVIEGTAQAAAAGMNPQIGQKSDQLSPDLSRSMTAETLAAARESIFLAFGVLPALGNRASTGPAIREAQRHLAAWQLEPIAQLIAQEATAKLGAAVSIDIGRPLKAFDAGGRARVLSQLVQAYGEAKELGLSPAEWAAALAAVNFGGGDANA